MTGVQTCALPISGVFHLQGIPQDSLGPLIMIECPRLLFPFARQIIADAVRQGGFPPLFIDPIDKSALKGMALADIALGDTANAARNLDLLEQTCGPRCPETLAVRDALNKAKKTEADASAAPLDKH